MSARGSPRSELARRGEDHAADYLRSRGYHVLERNWRPSGVGLRGELDIVATGAGVLAVVEVKARRSDRYGGPLAAVGPAKQAQIRRLTLAYLAQRGGGGLHVRFDVIGVLLRGDGPRLEHVAGAF